MMGGVTVNNTRSLYRKQFILSLVFFMLFLDAPVKVGSTVAHSETLGMLKAQFPDIHIPDDTLFIGLGDAWMISEETLTIYNRGAGVLEIFDISSDTPQFYSLQKSLTINGHEYTDIIIVFDPEIEPTDYHADSAILTIHSNDPDEGIVSVFVRAGFTPWYIRGDVTGDGFTNVLDVLAVANHILDLIRITGDAY